MSIPIVLRDAIGSVLKPVGFKKKRGSTWYWDHPEVISVVNLQKSPWSRQYYINLAVWIRAGGEKDKPLEYECPVRMRWGHWLRQDDKYLQELLNLENLSWTDEARRAEVSRYLREYVVPFFNTTSSAEMLKSRIQANDWPRGAWVTVDALRLLGLPVPCDPTRFTMGG